jgi:N-acetyl-anhydromuramyl-L-alanine amidase AmpD
MKKLRARSSYVLVFCLALIYAGCVTTPRIGQLEPRAGDEIVAAGQFFHTDTKVVLWMDPGGYDAYRVERRFSPFDQSSWEISHSNNPSLTPNRYGLRRVPLTPEQIEQVRGGGWDLPLLQQFVDQFVMHFDVAGTSRKCFQTLQDDRCLSVHFMIDVDGTIYQTLDLKERAWHATTSNDRSIGVEIANVGAYSEHGKNPFSEWYHTTNDETILTIPARYNDTELRKPGFVARPARPQPVHGNIQGENLVQYDFTPEQYQALIRLTAAVCKIFPKIQCRYPTDADGKLITHKLSDDQLKNYHGIIGHYHIQTNKVDPGPAFQWDYVITNAQKILDDDKYRKLMSPHGKELAGGR